MKGEGEGEGEGIKTEGGRERERERERDFLQRPSGRGLASQHTVTTHRGKTDVPLMATSKRGVNLAVGACLGVCHSSPRDQLAGLRSEAPSIASIWAKQRSRRLS